MSLIKSTHGPNWEKKNNRTGPIIRDSRVVAEAAGWIYDLVSKDIRRPRVQDKIIKNFIENPVLFSSEINSWKCTCMVPHKIVFIQCGKLID